MQSILFVGANFEQYLRLKAILNNLACIYSVSLPDGIRQFNQQQFCLLILDLSLIASDSGQEELLRSFRRAHPVPIIALCGNTEVVRLLNAGADQVLDAQTPDEVLAAYIYSLINQYAGVLQLYRTAERCPGRAADRGKPRDVEQPSLAGAVDRGFGMLAMYSIFYADADDALLCSGNYWIFDTVESAQAFADQQAAQNTVTTIAEEDPCVLYACPDSAETAEMMSIFEMTAVSDYVTYFAEMIKATVQ